MKRYIDADMLKEDFIVSGLFDPGELGVIIPIIEKQPVIEVPTPHGDLIDRDRIIERDCEKHMTSPEFVGAVYAAPVVIEAEN